MSHINKKTSTYVRIVRGYALGKRTAPGDRVSPVARASQSLVEAVARVRAVRKILRGGYNASLKAAKVNGESVDEDEILEELSEEVDKFSLSLTNKDFQISLVMSTETT